MEPSFLRHPDRAWCIVDDEIVLLDLVEDRYFCLPRGRSAELLSGHPELRAQASSQPARLPVPDTWAPPERTSQAMSSGPFDLSQVARALWVQRRVERRLSARGLLAVIEFTRATLARAHRPSRGPASGADRVIRAFEHARILRSAANRCLPRSIALALALARTGARPVVVIGVRLAPFSAHCWVQIGQDVASDTVEEVRRFIPILVF